MAWFHKQRSKGGCLCLLIILQKLRQLPFKRHIRYLTNEVTEAQSLLKSNIILNLILAVFATQPKWSQKP